MGKHVAGSVSFLSNIMYWKDSGYFDTASQEKWLLHTWSLSVEWQFYITYPVALIAIRKILSLKSIKIAVLLSTLLGFILCIFTTYKSPSAAYYLLPARAWEMMIGGVAYLYPFKLQIRAKRLLEYTGLALIVASYFLVSEKTPWPGYIAILPVLGSFFIIQAQNNNSIITSNGILQKLGAWSYSIYLWHWPMVVGIYYYSLSRSFIYLGLCLSVLLGFLSYNFIEKIKFKNNLESFSSYLRWKTLYIFLILCIAGIVVLKENGFITLAPANYQYLLNNAMASPYRDRCHISNYEDPSKACEYFGENISWATLGDSHSTELAYALAQKLHHNGIGLKHFSFSGCVPSFKEDKEFSKCSNWYNEAVSYILNNNSIQNVVLNHRFISILFGGDEESYPFNKSLKRTLVTSEVIRVTKRLDEVILKFAQSKEDVYVFYPIPELPKDISQLIHLAHRNGTSLLNVLGSDLKWYEKRNEYFISHFNNAKYPSNVHLLDPRDAFCTQTDCFAVKDGVPLYFDDDHPSVLGATKLVELIKKSEER